MDYGGSDATMLMGTVRWYLNFSSVVGILRVLILLLMLELETSGSCVVTSREAFMSIITQNRLEAIEISAILR